MSQLQLWDEEHLESVVSSLESLEGVRVELVIDPVEQAHRGGKIAMKSRVPLESILDMRRIYTPGVAQICRLIHSHPEQRRQFTSIGNSVAVVSNGTAVLGLGNIGAVASMPVMEGKAVLYERLANISAVPILIESKNVDEIVTTVKSIASTFGAIHLEDIAAPECFEIEDRLSKELSIPVLHDDRHGTAVVVLAAMMTIAMRTGIHIGDSTIGVIGLGAAGSGICQLLRSFGIKGLYGADLREEARERLSHLGGIPLDLAGVMKTCDIVVATTGCPGLIKAEMVRPGQIIMALSNPDPEITTEEALERGAAYAADGRTINNALAFPGLFKGALISGAASFTDEMTEAAAHAISGQTRLDDLVPEILDRTMHEHVARAVAAAVSLDQAVLSKQ
ncbi:MAG: NAD-dependent malic enzyme [Cyanobacteria bacterium]|nr:NAD-dependent malic enzyme [Cyanobacteriota bacterium]